MRQTPNTMKHPLTSKERRGLVAVAAAALLCIGSGPILRHCSSSGANRNQSVAVSSAGDSLSHGKKDSIVKEYKKTKAKRSGKSKAKKKSRKREKTYPTRHPLDEPIE